MVSMSHIEFGQKGEEIAVRYLMDGGFVLHHRNWRSGPHEIDIVADWHGEIVFVEVKTRHSEELVSALSAVDQHKRNNLILAAQHYMALFYHGMPRPYRFDIITIIGESSPYKLTHYRRAFTKEDFHRLNTPKRRRWNLS